MEEFIFNINGKDYQNIGNVSNTVKKIVSARQFPAIHSRRIAVAIFEVETNVILYANKGNVSIQLENDKVVVVARDEGKGIENVSLAMREGYTTADEYIRKLGFGAGLGLSNINKNADIIWISSIVNKGTEIILTFFLTSVL